MTKAKTPEELTAYLRSASTYERAAADWVARYNASPEAGVTQPNPLTNNWQITDVTFALVGSYFYSEDTFDMGSTGIRYTFWEKRSFKKGRRAGQTLYYPCEMEIRWYDGMSAGKFIEECVALMQA